MTIKEREAINQRQQEFYNNKKKNPATKVWSHFRNGLLKRIRKKIGIEREIYDQHKAWFGNLSKKKVLDLGCYKGNSLSYFLAVHSREYWGIDLSEKGIEILNQKLNGLPNAQAIAIDFLSENFIEKEFDLIYAYGVLHHFKDTEELINKLQEKLVPGGRIISMDPLQTNLPIKLIRSLYRPFQSDREWEWPFSRKTYYTYEKAFRIVERRAVLGKTKWFFLINLLPLSKERKEIIGKRWQREDWERSSHSDSAMFNCMHLTMLMQKRD